MDAGFAALLQIKQSLLHQLSEIATPCARCCQASSLVRNEFIHVAVFA